MVWVNNLITIEYNAALGDNARSDVCGVQREDGVGDFNLDLFIT